MGPRAAPTLLVTALLVCTLAVGCVRDEAEGVLSQSAGELLELEPLGDVRLTEEDLPRGRKELTFSSTPYLGEQQIVRAFQPIAAHLSEALGVPVRFKLARTYKELIERTAAGELDIIQLSPLSYVLARDQVKDLRLLASSLSFGATTYSSFFVVRSDDRISSLDDLRRRRVAFVDERSGSGFLFPYAALGREGIDPERDLEMVFTGSHDRSIDELIAGKVDAAAVSSGTLNNARRGEVIGVGSLRILHKAGRIPYDALCTNGAIPESGARKIAAAFGRLNTRTRKGRQALYRARGLTGWVRVDDRRYDEIRRILTTVRPRRWRGWRAERVELPGPTTEGGQHEPR